MLPCIVQGSSLQLAAVLGGCGGSVARRWVRMGWGRVQSSRAVAASAPVRMPTVFD